MMRTSVTSHLICRFIASTNSARSALEGLLRLLAGGVARHEMDGIPVADHKNIGSFRDIVVGQRSNSNALLMSGNRSMLDNLPVNTDGMTLKEHQIRRSGGTDQPDTGRVRGRDSQIVPGAAEESDELVWWRPGRSVWVVAPGPPRAP